MPPRVAKRKAADMEAKVKVKQQRAAATRAQPARRARSATTSEEPEDEVPEPAPAPAKKTKRATATKKAAATAASKAKARKAETEPEEQLETEAAEKAEPAEKKAAAGGKKGSQRSSQKTASQRKSSQKTASQKTESQQTTSQVTGSFTSQGTAAEDGERPAKRARKVRTREPKAAKPLPVILETPQERLHVFAFGTGESSELGLGPTAKVVKRPRLNQYLLPETTGIVDLALGGMHGLALTHDGKVYSWGVNDLGALGRDTKVDEQLKDMDASDSEEEDEVPLNPKESIPGLVELPAGVIISKIAAGDSISLAVTNTGQVYGWGTIRCSDGPIGFSADNEKFEPIPHLMPTLKNVVDVSIGTDHVLCLTKEGKVLAWGNGEQYQLGRRVVERTRKNALLPREFGLPRRKVRSVATGAYHSFAIMEDGKVYVWGLNSFGQCGIWDDPGQADDENKKFVQTPKLVTALAEHHIVQIAAGHHHSAAINDKGELFVWGRMDAHQIGIDPEQLPDAAVICDSAQRPRILTVPTRVAPDMRFKRVACGTDHNLAIAEHDESVWSWGFGLMFQVGQGPGGEDVAVPTKIENTATRGFRMKQVACGGNFSAIGGVPGEDASKVNGVAAESK